MSDEKSVKMTADDWITTFNARSMVAAASQASRQAFQNALTFGTENVPATIKTFLQQLPHEIIGGMNAKGIDVTPKNITNMFGLLFDDMTIIDTLLHPTVAGQLKSVNPVDYHLGEDQTPIPPDDMDIFEDGTDERTKKFLRRGREQHNDRISINSALATAFRANHDDVRTLPSNALVVFEMQRKIATAVSGVIETTYPGALTNPNHEVWGNDAARFILWDLRDSYIKNAAFFSAGFEELGRKGPT